MAKLCLTNDPSIMQLSQIQTPCWYAVHTRNNHEKAVSQALMARGIDCFLPIYETVSRWKDRKVLLERPLFPGYIFAYIPVVQKIKIVSVPSVVNVLCDRPLYDAINEEQVNCLRKRFTAKSAEPHTYLTVGQRVSIVRGPFSGIDGILLQHRATSRVVISLPAIVRSFSVEVDLLDIRDCATLAPSTLARNPCPC